MTSLWLRVGPLSVAAILLVTTRFPGDSSTWAYASLLGGVLLVACAAASLAPRTPATLRSGVYLLGLLLILIPPSERAWLAVLPDGLVAVLFVLALHLFFLEAGTTAPPVGAGGGGMWGRNGLRFLPIIVAAAALLVLPWASQGFLPPRIHAAYELQGAMAPLVPLVFLAAFLVAGGLLRSSGRGPRDQVADGEEHVEVAP